MKTEDTAKRIVGLMDELASKLENKYILIFESGNRRHYFWTKRRQLEIVSVIEKEGEDREIPLYKPIVFDSLEGYFRGPHVKPNWNYLNPVGPIRGGSNKKITKKGYFPIVIANLEAAINKVNA